MLFYIIRVAHKVLFLKLPKIKAVSKLISKENETVLVHLENGYYHIIKKYDIISAI
ncbi:MAG: hypothetical protein WAO74_09660 [Polaribacter sp.]|uniref:hypothetical protein n=1 Tax=Polaribacter sp. TaxID=1920175 RepID=UPI003BB209BB